MDSKILHQGKIHRVVEAKGFKSLFLEGQNKLGHYVIIRSFDRKELSDVIEKIKQYDNGFTPWKVANNG